ncbi:hypothetical protein GEU84_017155 [Fertoebacter nigrum]|uniref:DUF1127 domain-containing protein n=1 Tax=Fertoeibacter niger TaxID=2656921 RepID=A0A8X8H4C2_9RHOB|nr:hypothetical protein [Fertoeibacter niger]NUB46124.1 hypothetical protein [Fertoeibacter niger]
MFALSRLCALWQRHQSLGPLLHRADDHLLRDIGLMRDDLEQLLQGNDSRIGPDADCGSTGRPRCDACNDPSC